MTDGMTFFILMVGGCVLACVSVATRGMSLNPSRRELPEPHIPSAMEDWDDEFRYKTGMNVRAVLHPEHAAYLARKRARHYGFVYPEDSVAESAVGAPIRVRSNRLPSYYGGSW